MVNGDPSPTVTGSATVTSKNVASFSSFATSGLTLSNNNYSLIGGSITASITPKALTISGITAADKVYDGLTTATVSTAGVTASVLQANGLVAGDSLTVSSTGNFRNAGNTANDKNVGNAKTVQLSSTYGGADVGNYAITDQATATASITPKALNISGITAADKVYDGLTTAAISTTGVTASVLQANGLVSGDAVTVSATGNFRNAGNTANDKNVGSAKTVQISSTYGGADVGNYTITDQATATASITPKDVFIYGVSADNKVFDNNSLANLKGQPKAEFIQGDQVTSIHIGSANFSDAKVGKNKFISLDHLFLQGPDANNYRPLQPPDLRANIVPSESHMSSVPTRFEVHIPAGVSQLYSPPGANTSGQLGKLDVLLPQSTSNDAMYTIKLDKYFGDLLLNNLTPTNMNAKLKSGEALPHWLKFEPSTLTLSVLTTGVQRQKVELLVGSNQNRLELNIAGR